MIKRLSLAILVILLFRFPASAQTTDFGIWYRAGARMALSGSVDFKLEGEIRTFGDASKIDEKFGEIGLSVKVLKYLSAATSYRLTSKIEDDNNYYLRHKFLADIKGKTAIGKVGLSCRLRYERLVKTYIKNKDDEFPDTYGRIKLEANYNIKNSKLEPVIYYETFTHLFEPTEKRFEKYRISAGVAYKFSRRHRVDIAYIFQRDYLPHLSDINVISLSYDFKI